MDSYTSWAAIEQAAGNVESAWHLLETLTAGLNAGDVARRYAEHPEDLERLAGRLPDPLVVGDHPIARAAADRAGGPQP